ncbi:hypothetical protein H6G33_19550 [Calothrix sp. FACHB-1219]|uniref:hypothetical protein n=1 Tax=unclassified Calothrix TaxID=2619626 RepID=UPI0016871377|nr:MULTISPECIES: hypothetical protein [unclassified Calothrix]MBD2206620.1 hypothetical protein [Calothrix sp. FACHB-168]MBD2219219.1 hypothetical protein [Calothrix sp. FACHB-1219]
MSNQHYPPAYLRYLKARLLNLGRPSFWVTAILLSVFGLVGWEYLSDPEILTQKPNPAVDVSKVGESSLSTEDRAAIADVDNFPALTQDLGRVTVVAPLILPEENRNNQNNQNLFDDVIGKKPAVSNVSQSDANREIFDTKSTLTENNPFVVQADNLLRSGYSHSPLSGAKSFTNSAKEIDTNTSANSSGLALANQAKINRDSVNISPLADAINKSQYQNNSNFPVSQTVNIMGSNLEAGVKLTNQNSTNQTNIMGNAAYNAVNNEAQLPSPNSLPIQTLPNNNNLNPGTIYNQPTATNLSQNSYANFNNSQRLINGTPTTTAVTPAVTSAASNNISPYSPPSSIPGVVNTANPIMYGNYGVQQPTQLPQSRISLPRPTPGPYGGVQINGYTYP